MIKLITLGCILILCACKKEEEPVACYDFTIDGGTVSFANCSSGSDDFQWEFGDGNGSISKAPTHEYANPGKYSVTLKVSNENGTKTLTKDLTIEEVCVTCYKRMIGTFEEIPTELCGTKQSTYVMKTEWLNSCTQIYECRCH